MGNRRSPRRHRRWAIGLDFRRHQWLEGIAHVWGLIQLTVAHAWVTTAAAATFNFVMLWPIRWVSEHGGVMGIRAWISTTHLQEREAALRRIRDALSHLSGTHDADTARQASDLITGLADWSSLDAAERRREKALSLGKPAYFVMWFSLAPMAGAEYLHERGALTFVVLFWMLVTTVFGICCVLIGALAFDRGAPPVSDKKPRMVSSKNIGPVPGPDGADRTSEERALDSASREKSG